MILAGRAAEELVFGREEMSSLHQHKLMQARQVSGVRGFLLRLQHARYLGVKCRFGTWRPQKHVLKFGLRCCSMYPDVLVALVRL